MPRPSPAPRPALLLVAHGSRDPRHATTVGALAARVRRLLPDGVPTEVGYLDFDSPSVPGALARLHAGGVREVVAVPLLLSRAFHAKSDIPQALRESAAGLPGMTVRQAPVLGPHPLLVAALERRLRTAGAAGGARQRASTGIVLASAGSTDPEAIAVIAEIAREWRRTAGWCAVRPAFASAALPRTADAVRALRADGVRQVAVAPYVLAPGFLPDRIAAGAREAGADALAPVLGTAEEVARLTVLRYAELSGSPEPLAPVPSGGCPSPLTAVRA
ncbi:sirohydrochlorin chelatase [Streptomyces boncukensis]|uniref:Sirohydrochlorin chelatase n=1 Tax=Streptomyces boncukensis TaxID=2711219 RepID=A0A6G4WU60_9ACTN|nr:sirohydrochlorin chelatase [Streptomyces boncukensis]NGO68819.1 sirohydrochlorin chelatase [Streptomyces boncukensis]